MKTYTAVFAALLAASTSSLLAAPAMASEGCSTVAQCLGHETASADSNRSSDDNGMGDTDRNRERYGNDDNGNDDNGRDDNGRDDNDHGAGHDNGNDSDHGAGHDDGNDNDHGGNDHDGGNDNDD